jgi:hypothetical protein
MKPSVSPDRSGLPAIFILRTSRAAVVICTTCSLPNAFKASDTHLTAACITTYRFLLYNHRDCRDTQSTSYFRDLRFAYILYECTRFCHLEFGGVLHLRYQTLVSTTQAVSLFVSFCWRMIKSVPKIARGRGLSSIAKHVPGYAVVALREASPLYPGRRIHTLAYHTSLLLQ